MTLDNLTKTQQKILRAAAQNHLGTVSATSSEGRGVLSVKAIRSLADMGLLGWVESYGEVDIRRGHITSYRITTATITDAGRHLVAGGFVRVGVNVLEKLSSEDAQFHGYNLPVRAWDQSTGRIVGCYISSGKNGDGRRRWPWFYVALDGGGHRYYTAHTLRALTLIPQHRVETPEGFYHSHRLPETDFVKSE